MADTEEHGRIWWFFHKLGIVHTMHENADEIRRWYSRYEILDDNGDVVEFDKMSDAEVIEFNREVLRRKLRAPKDGDPAAAGVLGSIPSKPSSYPGSLNDLGSELGWPRGNLKNIAKYPNKKPSEIDLDWFKRIGGSEKWCREQAQIYRQNFSKVPTNKTFADRAQWLEDLADRLR